MQTPDEQTQQERDATMRGAYDLRVFIVGGGFQYAKMFYDAGFKGAVSVADADIVCFTGGEDVDPSFYKEKKLPGTYSNSNRDEFEAGIYGECLALKKAMIGICRGSQFLCVMNGGKLWQDVDKHATGYKHSVTHVPTGDIKFNMTSTHHQQMIPPEKGAELIAVAKLCTLKVSEHETIKRDEPELDDVEVVWFPDTLTLCFQPHPEFAEGECRKYFLELVDEYILPAC